MYSDAVPGGLAALAGLAREAGFERINAEDGTDEWREYYVAALWRGEAEPPPEGKSFKNTRYLSAILRRNG